ncbi:MAG: hypothetical protein GOVbin4580_10 [Prokaryotic dsDNA virus sp.]|nr:MAG: hypothetical protein GOVbin4580_10 [Prokaryotic dsDNA virus sp.]|tara:strand:+ start:2345 stop:3382 length:1038 start_codon:yes stop_codon:yes gene_type:complete
MPSTNYEALCNINDDLQVVLPNLNAYNVRRPVEGFVQSSGIVYEAGGVGYVEMLFRDGKELGTAQSSASDVNADGEYHYAEDTDLLTIASTNDPSSEHFYEAGLDWKSTREEAVNRASAFVREYVNRPIRRIYGEEGSESTGNYQDIIVRATSHLAVASIVRPYDFEKAQQIEGIAYNEETNTGLLNLIKAGEIPLWDDTTARKRDGIVKKISVNASSTGGIADVLVPEGTPYVDWDRIKVIIKDDGNSGSGANLVAGSSSNIKYSVFTKNDDGIKIDETVKDEPINGDYQELAYGTFIRWSIGGTSSATSSKYYTNDEWEIEFDGQPIESGSGIGALQVIRSDY